MLASSVYFLFVKLFQQVYGPDFEGTTFVQECMFPGKHLMYDKALWMTTLKMGSPAEYYPIVGPRFVNLIGIQAVDVYSRNWERVPDWKDGGTANDWIGVAFKPGSPFYSQLNLTDPTLSTCTLPSTPFHCSIPNIFGGDPAEQGTSVFTDTPMTFPEDDDQWGCILPTDPS